MTTTMAEVFRVHLRVISKGIDQAADQLQMLRIHRSPFAFPLSVHILCSAAAVA